MNLLITLVISVLFGGGAGALTALLIVKSRSGARQPAAYPQQGFAPQSPQQYPPQQYPPQQGFGQPPQGPYPPQ
ncbi:hypothetical protein MOQ72_07065 [Saccharopolyspora sp. K220]|uniref:hypothetical protein n=1 Tax=Saccharopolyspora soli TaxID=2926618 RepID=UPI001F5AE154|nr:hypothetical protein [Saccharopolyspora soli]MCI2417177.1 hypothetical protein [Saccharopolyspora soli]